MRNFLKFSFSAFALMFLFSAFAAIDANAQNPQAEALKRMDEHYKTLQSLKANILMKKYNAQLDETDESEGKVMYLPQKNSDAYIRIDWSKPMVESLAVIKKEYIIYRPKLQQAFIGTVDKAKGSAKSGGALAFMNMSRKQLKDNYTINYFGEERVGGVSTFHLELIPKIKTSYKKADLWIDKDGMPIQATVTENNSDTTTVLLSNLEKNKTLDGNLFAINPPKGTKIVRN
jgi:outer membrane lipoprotein-sorting protein